CLLFPHQSRFKRKGPKAGGSLRPQELPTGGVALWCQPNGSVPLGCAVERLSSAYGTYSGTQSHRLCSAPDSGNRSIRWRENGCCGQRGGSPTAATSSLNETVQAMRTFQARFLFYVC